MFDEAAELVLVMTPDELGEVHVRAHRRGVKVWFDSANPTKEHYEAQLLSRRYVDGRDGMALEVGFHIEHKDVGRNTALLERIVDHERAWRRVLGDEPEAAVFFGAENWRRVSEAWLEPDVDDPELAFEVAARLVDYVTTIEPLRR